MKVGYQILADLQQQQAFKQWGYYVESQNPTDYRYWSIPFTSHYITMATKTYYEPKEEAVPWLVGIDMQKFICGYGANFIGSSYVSCVGIGCQPQWGYSNTGKTGHITISLPISATQILMGLASYVDAIGAGDIGVYDISPTSIIIDVDSGKLGKTDFYWFVLGTV